MQIEITSDENERTLAWKLHGKGAHVALTAPWPTSDDQKVEVLTRLACHYLVENVDDSGLNELLGTLVDIVGFYSDRAALPEYTEQTDKDPFGSAVRAISAGSFKRESFAAE